uniref:Uncharacterized protein n=1 Tax=Leersia perrieri TaxID=77586 RepID=A0A0D9X9P6_9ORYZ
MARKEAGYSGGVEVRKEELRGEEAPLALEESKEIVERMDGEAVSNPIKVASDDSDDLAQEVLNSEDKPNLSVLREGGEAMEFNVALGCDKIVNEDSVDDGREAGVVEDSSMVNGHLHPEAPGCAVNGELASSEIVVLVHQEVDDQELEGINGRTSYEYKHDHTNTCIGKSKDHMENIFTNQAVDDATGLTEQDTINGEQESDARVDNGHNHVVTSENYGEREADGEELKGVDGRTSNGHDHSKTSKEESKVHMEDNFINQADVDAIRLTEHETISGGQQLDILVENVDAHVRLCADCGEGVEKCDVLDDRSNNREVAANSVKLVDQEAGGVGQDGLDGSLTKGPVIAIVDTRQIFQWLMDMIRWRGVLIPMKSRHGLSFEESSMTQSVVEGVHHERTIKMVNEQIEGDVNVVNKKVPRECALSNVYENVKESEGDTNVSNKKVPGEGKILINGYEHVEESVDTNLVLKPLVGNGQYDLIHVHRLEDRAEDNTDTCVVKKNDDVAIDCSETKEKNDKTNDKILQGHDLFNDKVERGVQDDETIKGDYDISTFQPIELVLCSTLEIEKGGTKQHTSLREGSLVSVQQQTFISLQDTKQELSATIDNHKAGNTKLKQESCMEVLDGAKLCVAPAIVSALHGETRSNSADNDGATVGISTLGCNLGTSSVALIKDNLKVEGATNEICAENANASCVVETEYVQNIAATIVDITHKQNDDEENMHINTDITGDHNESQLEINTNIANKGGLQFVIPHSVYLMKVPLFMGESLWAKIQDAQICLDELTQKRDAINVPMQKKKVLCNVLWEQLEATRQEERGSRTAYGDKRNDLNSVQSTIGRMNGENSVQEIDDMIAMEENIIEHESICLKEEKCLLQDIKELKAQKKQLHSNMDSKVEIGEEFQQKEHTHEQLKILKDYDVLLTNLKSLEDKTRSIKKNFDDEQDALRKLIEELQVADEVHQRAYDEWFELKKEP